MTRIKGGRCEQKTMHQIWAYPEETSPHIGHRYPAVILALYPDTLPARFSPPPQEATEEA